MKLLGLLFVTLLAMASCHISFLEKFEQSVDDSNRNKDDIAAFFEGVFSYFNLSSPTQIKDCFCDVNAGLYFKLLEDIGDILKDTKDRNTFKLHLEYGKISLRLHHLKDTHACIFMTQDFTNLLNAVNLKERNPHEFGIYTYIFYQAHYRDLFEGFKPVLENFNTESINAAGNAFGALIHDTVAAIKEEGFGHIIFTAFGNGGAIALDIDEPDDSLQCYDNAAATLLMEFIYKMSAAVANGDWREGALNAIKFIDSEGKDLISKIPKEDFDCTVQSQDTQEFSRAIGIDMTSTEFHDRLVRYIYDNRLQYYSFSKSLKTAFDNGNLHHAGSIYYNFLKKVAAWK